MEQGFRLPPSGRCRHASIRTLEERFISLGACWAFSVQPVLPSDWRPVVLLLQSRTWRRRLTQSPELGFGLLSFLFGNGFDFCFVFLFYTDCRHCSSAAVLLHWFSASRRSPTGDARQPRELSGGGDDGSLLAALSATLGQLSVPSVAGHSPNRPNTAPLHDRIRRMRGLPLC